MRRYRLVVRLVFGVIFLVGGVVHLVIGRTAPSSYAVYGDTAVLPSLRELWSTFVMPQVGWLTLVLAALEIAAGAGLLAGGRWARPAVLGILGFFAFLLVLGYGWPTTSVPEDLLKNRAGTLVMAALLLPVLGERRSRTVA